MNAIQNNADVGLAARNEKAEVLVDTGKREEADVIYKKIIDDYQKGLLKKNADQLFVARALWATGNYYDANETFKLIKRIDPQNAEAMVAWGDLLAYSTAPRSAPSKATKMPWRSIPTCRKRCSAWRAIWTEDEDNSPEKAFKRGHGSQSELD